MKPYLIREASTPLAYIFECWSLIKTVASAEQGIPNVSSTDASGRDVIYKSNVFTIVDINTMVYALVKRWDELLRVEIHDDCQSPWLELRLPLTLVDSPRNMDAGFCFLDLPANNLLWFKNTLIQHYMEHPDLKNKFFYRKGDKMFAIRTELEKKMRSEAEMTDILMVLIAITSGSPARAIEQVNHLVRNQPGGSIRNFFHLYGLTMIISGYSKTSTTTLKDKVIPRVPPPLIVQRLLYQLVIIRPAMERFATICRDARTAARYRYFLYPGLDQPRTSTEFSHILATYTGQYLPAPLHILDWRQIAVGFSRFNGNLLNIKAASGTKFSTYQMGHGEETENRHYAITPDMLVSVSHERVMGCIATSGAWHILLGLGNDVSKVVGKTVEKDIHSEVGVVNQNNDAPPNLNMVQLTRMAIDDMRDDLCREMRLSFAHSAALYWPEPPPQSGSYVRSLVAPPQRLRQLRTFFNDPKAIFRDERQSYALELVIQREKNLLLIFPTGEYFLLNTTRRKSDVFS